MEAPFSKSRINELLRDMEIDDLNKASIRQIGAIARTMEQETGQEYVHFEMGIPGLPPSTVGVEAEIAAEAVEHSAQIDIAQSTGNAVERAGLIRAALTQVDCAVAA